MSDGNVVIDILADAKQYQATVAGLSAETNKVVTALASSMMTAGKGLTLGLTAPILLFGAYSAKAAIDFESSFAGVRKTTNATEQEFEALAQASKRLSAEKVIDANAANHVMELGSQLGIAKNNLVDFTGVIADLDVSTDLGIEDASTQMAQFANITGMSQDKFSNFGSTIVALGNTSATTESKIMSMGMRIAGSADQVGMTDDQILALSASLSAVGIEAEMGGTAISTVISQIDKDVATGSKTLDVWAQTAGMSAAEFKTAWETDAAGALQKIFAGMNAASESGGNLNLVLDEMGVTALRQGDMMKRLSNGSVLLGASIDTASKAWNENTALTREAEQRYMTTESQMAMLGNKMNNVASTMGGPLLAGINGIIDGARPLLDILQNAATGFAKMDEGQRQVIVTFALLAAGVGPVLMGLSKFLTMSANASKLSRDLAAALAAEQAAKIASAAASATETSAKAAGTIATGANTAAKVANTAATGVNTGASAANATSKATGAAATTADTVSTVANTGAKGIAAAATTVLTAAQVSLNAAMAANPIGVVLLAVGALAAALAGLSAVMDATSRENTELTETSKQQEQALQSTRAEYEQAAATYGETSNQALALKSSLDEQTAAFDAGKQSIKEMYAECDEAVKSHKDLAAELDTSTASANAEAGSIVLLASRIEELSNKTNKSQADQATLVSLLEDAGQKIPGVTAAYDAQNDTMSQSVEVINKLANAEADRVKAKAHMDNYNKLLGEQAVLEEQLAKAQAQQEAETERATGSLTGNASAVSKANDAVKKLEEALEENNADQQFAADAASASEDAQRKLADAVNAVTEGHMTASEAAEKFGADEEMVAAQVEQAQEDQKQAVVDAKNEMRKAIDEYVAATPSFAQALNDAGLSVEGFASILESQGVTMDEAAKEIEGYRDRLTSAFDEIEVNRENTAARAAATLQKNIDATATWNSNLSTLYNESGLSFNQDFIDAVTKGGPEEYGQMISDLIYATQNGGTIMVGDVEMTAQQIIDKFGEAGALAPQQYVAQIMAGTGLVNSAGQSIVTANGQGIIDAAGQAWSAAEFVRMGTEEQLAIKDALARGEDITELWAQGLATAAPESAVQAEGAAQGVKDALSSVADAALASGGEVGAKLAEGITGQAPAVQGSIQALSDTVTQTMATAATGAQASGASVGLNIATGITGQTGAVQLAISGVAGSISMAVGAIQLQPVGANLTSDLASGVSSGIPQVLSGLTTIATLITSTMRAVDLQPIGAGMSAKLASGVTSGASAVQSATQSTADAAVEAMSDAPSRARDIGWQMSAGMAGGILDNSGSVERAMATVVNAAIARGKAEADINSPSRRVAKEIGQWMPLGGAVGIESTGHTMVDAMGDVVSATVKAADTTLPPLAVPMSFFGADLPDNARLALESFSPRLPSAFAVSDAVVPVGDAEAKMLKAMESISKRIDVLDAGLGRKIADNTPDKIKWNEREMGRFVKSTVG